jgi:hypothetical protein
MKAFLLFLIMVGSHYGFAQRSVERYSNKYQPAKEISTVSIDSVALCNALNQFITEAALNFVHIKGNVIDNTKDGTIYSATRGLPGTITSSVVNEKGWSYEGIVYQGKNKEEISNTYTTYKRVLDKCMSATGYESKSEQNEAKGLEHYPTIKYSKQGSSVPYPALAVGYSDINAIYTVTISVNK